MDKSKAIKEVMGSFKLDNLEVSSGLIRKINKSSCRSKVKGNKNNGKK